MSIDRQILIYIIIVLSIIFIFYQIYLYLKKHLRVNVKDKSIIYSSNALDAFVVTDYVFYKPETKRLNICFVFKFKNNDLMKNFLTDLGVKLRRYNSQILSMRFTQFMNDSAFSINADDLTEFFDRDFKIRSSVLIYESGHIDKFIFMRNRKVNLLKGTVAYDIIFSTYVLFLIYMNNQYKHNLADGKVEDYEKPSESSLSHENGITGEEKKDNQEENNIEKEQNKEEKVINLFGSIDKYIKKEKSEKIGLS